MNFLMHMPSREKTWALKWTTTIVQMIDSVNRIGSPMTRRWGAHCTDKERGVGGGRLGHS